MVLPNPKKIMTEVSIFNSRIKSLEYIMEK
jgi:hypothetical protein